MGVQAAAAAGRPRRTHGGGGESFLRVGWVAMPEELRARRPNRRGWAAPVAHLTLQLTKEPDPYGVRAAREQERRRAELEIGYRRRAELHSGGGGGGDGVGDETWDTPPDGFGGFGGS
eukprot:COSAG01_NODE_2359_length_7836_cov_107.706605_5_plen_118_part_00